MTTAFIMDCIIQPQQLITVTPQRSACVTLTKPPCVHVIIWKILYDYYIHIYKTITTSYKLYGNCIAVNICVCILLLLHKFGCL